VKDQYLSEIKSFGSLPSQHLILLGAQPIGFIEALGNYYSEKNITVFDCVQPSERCQLKNISYFIESDMNIIFQSDFFDFILKNLPMVLTSSAAWQGRESQLSKYFSLLTGRSPKSFEMHMIEFGFEIKALPKQEALLNIKEVFQSMPIPVLEKSPELLILKELIR
jgi:hypothetical protein